MDKEQSEVLRLTLEKEVAAVQQEIDLVQADAGATPYSQRTPEWKIKYTKQIDEYLRKMEDLGRRELELQAAVKSGRARSRAN